MAAAKVLAADKAHFIAQATAHAHGQFAAKARAAHMTTRAYAEQEKDAKGKLGKEARLALVLMGTHHK